MLKHKSRSETEVAEWLPVEAFMLMEKLSASDLVRLLDGGLRPRIQYAGDRPFVHMPSVRDWKMLAENLHGFRRLRDIELEMAE